MSHSGPSKAISLTGRCSQTAQAYTGLERFSFVSVTQLLIKLILSQILILFYRYS
jgi:hypothetical protein